MILEENDKIITQDIKVAEELNSFFLNVVENLKIPRLKHQRVIAIRDLNIRSYFQFSLVSDDEVLKEIKKLNPRKATLRTFYIRSPWLHRIPMFLKEF